jgi:peptidoglycan biosynthesis protein MviN/MurJ (putative lipid II flippase)
MIRRLLAANSCVMRGHCPSTAVYYQRAWIVLQLSLAVFLCAILNTQRAYFSGSCADAFFALLAGSFLVL